MLSSLASTDDAAEPRLLSDSRPKKNPPTYSDYHQHHHCMTFLTWLNRARDSVNDNRWRTAHLMEGQQIEDWSILAHSKLLLRGKCVVRSLARSNFRRPPAANGKMPVSCLAQQVRPVGLRVLLRLQGPGW